MTVKDEVGRREDYDVLRFVEFLEFIGRVAHTKYVEDHGATLETKVERILDDILPVYGLKRKIEGETFESDESSEESVCVEDEEVQAKVAKKADPHVFAVWNEMERNY